MSPSAAKSAKSSSCSINRGFGTGPADQSGYFLQRYLFSSDFHLGPRFRVFTELQSAFEEGRKGGPRPTDVDHLDLHQAFLDLQIAGTEPEGSRYALAVRKSSSEAGD